MAEIDNIMTVPWATIAYVGPTVAASVGTIADGSGGLVPPAGSYEWVLNTVSTPNYILYMTYDSAGYIWGLRRATNDVVKIDPNTNTIVATWASSRFGARPVYYGAKYDPIGDNVLFGCTEWQQAVISVATGVVSFLRFDWWITGPCFTPDYIYHPFASNGGAGRVRRFTRGNYTEGQDWAYADVTGGIPTNAQFSNPVSDGTHIWVASGYWTTPTIRKISIATNALVASYTLSGYDDVAVDRPLVLHNGYLYLFNNNDCFEFNTTDGTWVKISDITGNAIGYIVTNCDAAVHDGNFYYVNSAGTATNTLTKINLDTLSVVNSEQFYPPATSLDVHVSATGQVTVPLADTAYGYMKKESF